MYIKSYSFDGENEASVVVTDGKFELICYAYPFNKKIKNRDKNNTTGYEMTNFR